MKGWSDDFKINCMEKLTILVKYTEKVEKKVH